MKLHHWCNVFQTPRWHWLATAGFKRLNCHLGFFRNISGPPRPSADLLGHILGISQVSALRKYFQRRSQRFHGWWGDRKTINYSWKDSYLQTQGKVIYVFMGCNGPGNWTEVWYEWLDATKTKRKMSGEDRQLGKIKQIRTVFADTLSRILRMNWQLLH